MAAVCAFALSSTAMAQDAKTVIASAQGALGNVKSITYSGSAHDVAFQQCVVKAIFVGAPVWRVVGLDRRLTPELARMALDLADERRSAGRPVPAELWLALGKHGGERGVASLAKELEPANGERDGRRAAALALARAGVAAARIEAWLAKEKDAEVAATLRLAVKFARSGAGAPDAAAFHAALTTPPTGA